ncbi:MAG: hypothetical protein U0M15_01860 [Bacillota bacterium]|nr:hypothetical protein [Bacillota bacterium]
MAKGCIEAGVCGMTTEIKTQEKDGMMEVLIDSECPHYDGLSEEIGTIDGMMTCFEKVGTGVIYEACRKTCPHGACPVPMAIMKTIEVGANMALPADVTLKLEK